MEQQKIVEKRFDCLEIYDKNIKECIFHRNKGDKKLCGKLAKARYNNCMANIKNIVIYTNTDKTEH